MSTGFNKATYYENNYKLNLMVTNTHTHKANVYSESYYRSLDLIVNNVNKVYNVNKNGKPYQS